MGFAFIREGDTTSHGGRVLACDPPNTVDGKALALLGDMVSCPRCGGVFPIVKVKTDLHMTFNGRPVASDGDMTACGATLIASQSSATASPTAGAGNPIGGGRSVVAEHAGAVQPGPHRGRFQLLDDDTGRPVANHPYTVTSSDGSTIAGTTDENGYTGWLETEQAASLTFERSSASSV
ncbi:PAAR domain-containing protein [Burkholderia multivorans]|uniref:PAAR domain-containing protein n=1 Tax=Burkholderia multivorans TaxID=87883 RepID=UPI0020184A25|nr:PAAR domain-containing protein [Burkholderia multivorans]MCL4650382.1 PAAR domain-containing protein [Burkholderia multivorans]MCL4656403.1 PAAR domain-containing protein [Burkholderia multivorans]MCO1424883.1 PAAR domain-containing protein [Burkholderia multivorans]UQN52423.1 PAAR domain-containing protein [Burkholderia multivorans]UQN83228.1 PAAR domain-containing protein [Burkholderia multivorans]